MTRQRMDHIDEMIESWAGTDPELDASPLQVAGRVLRLAAVLRARIDEALDPFGLSYGDFDVLNTLRREGGTLSPTRLAEAALITSGAMTTRLNRLEARGLVRRTPDAADRRSMPISLTPQGKRLARRALDAVLAVDRALIAPLSAPQQASITSGLRTMLRAAEQ
ncbi:MarR family winged helix-turn-helix transcriptional regulator [Epidermidibacterium keratini]|nr:MarR family transcriptional regulator [Epidermidibacterium keratini]